VFLLLTVALSLWLGFQAVAAARSNRRIAAGILADYSDIAVSEYYRRTEERIDRLFRELFDEVPWRVRREPPPPDVVARQLGRALRRSGCECEDLRNTAVFLAADLRTGTVRSVPDDLPADVAVRVRERILERWRAATDERIALFTEPAGALQEAASVVAFNISLDADRDDGSARAVYAMLVPLPAVAELFGKWYREAPLLPAAVAGDQPNDSLLHVAVLTPDGDSVFRSQPHDAGAVAGIDTLPDLYGGLILEAAVRPNAAGALIIGGLPRSRLPLLLTLMILTIGVGIAAWVQIRKEQELARLRDDFISGVSHEFRTPLTQIRMFTELMADGKLRTEEDRSRSTAVINREARRLTHLVENLLYFARMGRAPAAPGTRERVPLAESMRELVEAFAPLARDRRASLAVRVDPADATALVSRSALYQMLANLLDNALKYGSEEQTITLAAEHRNGRVRLTVEDEGPGIPLRERDRIWEPYHRLQRDVAGVEVGSGLGLSVVKQLAEAGGGSAWLEDGDAGGARFVVELPTGAREAGS
jgi:signal transduction histidine kinase